MATEVLRREAGVWSLRILDNTTPTPNGVVVPFVQSDFSGELRNPRPASIVRLNGGVIDQYAHVIPGNDEFLAAGVPYTFTYWPDIKTAEAIWAAMSNGLDDVITTDSWPVGASTFKKTNGSGAQMYNGAGVLTDPIQSADPRQVRVTVETLHLSGVGGSDLGLRFEECFFESIVPTNAATQMDTRVTFRRFGAISVITAFTAFTDITPAVT